MVHVFRWSPARFRYERGGAGKRRSLISSPSGRALLAINIEKGCGDQWGWHSNGESGQVHSGWVGVHYEEAKGSGVV